MVTSKSKSRSSLWSVITPKTSRQSSSPITEASSETTPEKENDMVASLSLSEVQQTWSMPPLARGISHKIPYTLAVPPTVIHRPELRVRPCILTNKLPETEVLATAHLPTVRTVETTTNAKVFFETHFDAILSNQASSRDSRRHGLELRLWAERVRPEQRYQERLLWVERESEYLRHLRVLKTRGQHMMSGNGVSIAGYEVVRTLGKGSFGVVRLVREKSDDRDERGVQKTAHPSALSNKKDRLDRWLPSKRVRTFSKEVYAMKVIRKSENLRSGQEGHLRAERDFLVASEKSRWIVPLITSFQDSTNLYLVMEFMIGGDFLGFLDQHHPLDETTTRFYIAEMVLCVEEAHRLQYIHRDVKPDNFLISASGHLKISDFGLAFDGHWAHDQTYYSHHRYSLIEKLGIKIRGDARDQKELAGGPACEYLTTKEKRDKDWHQKPSLNGETLLRWRDRHGRRAFARSVAGTQQYMAPEVISGTQYDGRCDWWSIGAIMYEVSCYKVLLVPHSCHF